MTLSMYQASVPVFIAQLKSLSHVLALGAADAEARNIDPSIYINFRLAPDMLPFSRQVQIACDMAKSSVARLSGTEIPSFPDTETSFPELQERIAKTIAYVETIKPEQLDGSEERPITIKSGTRGDLNFKGQDYLLGFVYGNLHFHCATAYAILRHNGVKLGKADYFGAYSK